MADRPDPTPAPVLTQSSPLPAVTESSPLPAVTESTPLPAVTESIVVDAELDDLWRTLTDGEELGRWLGADVDLDLVPGARGHVVDDDGSRRVVEVDAVVTGRSLRWRWRPTGADGQPAGPSGGDDGWSVVEITVAPVADGFEVRVTEAPAPTAPGVASACAADVGGAGRWTGRLLGLELRHLRHRRPVAVGA